MKQRLNVDRLYRTLTTLDLFVDLSLGLEHKGKTLSGFDYNRELIYAAVANTYVETIGDKADSLHLAIKKRKISDVFLEYLETVKILGRRVNLKEQDVVLAFDYTDEDYYGELEGFWIHGWTGRNAVKGKFKFLTCAIVCTSAPIRVPILSIPVQIGHNMADTILYSIKLVQPLVKSILLILFDRGFYSKELMLTLSEHDYPYLIFVPKNKKVKKELETMANEEKKTIHYEFKLTRNKTTVRGDTTLAFLKQIYDKRSDKNYDWAFATNMNEIDLDHIIQSYKKRWRIETMFRVQDEAHIMSKSKDMSIRFFYFAYAQTLQLIWAVVFKEEVSFKEFLILLNETAKERAEKAERKRLRKPGSKTIRAMGRQRLSGH